MSIIALTDARLWLAEHDVTGDANEVGLDWQAETKDRTTFGSNGKRAKTGGIETVTASLKIFADFEAAGSDAALAALNGQNDKPCSFGSAAAAGSVAYITKALHSKRQPIVGKIGDTPLTDAMLEGSSNEGLIRGRIMAAKATVSAGGSTTGIQLGAVSSTQRVYVLLHVFDITGGGTLTCTLVSDDNSAFTSPTSRTAMTGATTAGAEWASTAGAITDDWWRINWGLTAGTATVAAVVGIQ